MVAILEGNCGLDRSGEARTTLFLLIAHRYAALLDSAIKLSITMKPHIDAPTKSVIGRSVVRPSSDIAVVLHKPGKLEQGAFISQGLVDQRAPLNVD